MGSAPFFKLHEIKGQRYTKTQVQVDGIRYVNCLFEDCTMMYSGGPAEASGCTFAPDTVWQFSPQVAIIVETLQRFGFRFSFGGDKGEEPVRFPSDAM